MLTPEQTRDLVDWAGGIRPAARAIGVTHPTILYWLRPDWAEAKRADWRKWYDRQSGVEYNRRLLYIRRQKALGRRRRRSIPREED